jgi:hypothetical protein
VLHRVSYCKITEGNSLVFRDQEMNIHEQLDLARHFGPLHKHGITPFPKEPGLEEVHGRYTVLFPSILNLRRRSCLQRWGSSAIVLCHVSQVADVACWCQSIYCNIELHRNWRSNRYHTNSNPQAPPVWGCSHVQNMAAIPYGAQRRIFTFLMFRY